MKTEKTIIYKKVHCMSFGYQKMLRAIFKYAAYRGIHTLKRGFADLIKTGTVGRYFRTLCRVKTCQMIVLNSMLYMQSL